MAGFALSFIDRPPIRLVTIVLKMTNADASGEILATLRTKPQLNERRDFDAPALWA